MTDKITSLEIKKLELEIQLKEAALKRNSVNNPLTLSIVGGFISIMTVIFTTYLQNNADRKLERQKLESSLIIKASESGDRAKAADFLKFLVRLGYLEDETGNIMKMADNGQIPLIGFHVDHSKPFVNQNGDTLLPFLKDTTYIK